jgi:hypothetical protein
VAICANTPLADQSQGYQYEQPRHTWVYGHLYAGRLGLLRPLADVTSTDWCHEFIRFSGYDGVDRVSWAALALLMLGIFGIFYHVFEPILHRQSVLWLVAMLLAGGNVVLGQVSGTLTLSYILVNNLTLVVVVLGIANLWAQSGMKARDAAMLAVLLGIYDVVFTSHLSVMGDLFDHLDDLPLAPLIAWGSMEDMQAIGVGDLLMATLFPLVMRKSYGQTAGILAQGLAIITIALISILAPAETLFPVMIILGPIMAVQYVFWRWQRGVERTTRQYRVDESAPC